MPKEINPNHQTISHIGNKLKKHTRTMTQEEIKTWIERWGKLKPSPKRDMVIKIWSNLIKTNQQDL